MNMNRQNNRFTTPPGVTYGGRPYGRQMAGNERAYCDNDGLSGVIGAGGVIGGITGRTDECGGEDVLRGLPIAMAYVPWQNFGNLHSLSQALNCGTLFQELSLDFMGRRCN